MLKDTLRTLESTNRDLLRVIEFHLGSVYPDYSQAADRDAWCVERSSSTDLGLRTAECIRELRTFWQERSDEHRHNLSDLLASKYLMVDIHETEDAARRMGLYACAAFKKPLRLRIDIAVHLSNR